MCIISVLIHFVTQKMPVAIATSKLVTTYEVKTIVWYCFEGIRETCLPVITMNEERPLDLRRVAGK